MMAAIMYQSQLVSALLDDPHRSEQEAIACVKKGMRPDKLMSKMHEETKEEPAPRGKAKGGKGGKRARAAQESNTELSRQSSSLETVQAKVCPFGLEQVMEILVADAESGQLTP